MNKMKTTLYGALVLLQLLSTSDAATSAKDDKQPGDETRRAADHARRKVRVEPRSSAVGLDSGSVILYGHPISGPYHFEYRDSILYVNGVQVEPTLVMQRDYDQSPKQKLTPDRAEKLKQVNAMANKVRDHYFSKSGKMADEVLRNEILETVRAHPLVKEAQWMNDKLLAYTSKDDAYPLMNGISFSPRSQRADAKPKKSQEQIKSEHISDLEAHLKTGGCLFFGTVGAWRGHERQCKQIKSSVPQIMKDEKLSHEEREKKLREAFGGSSEDAKDVLSNYSEAEWK